MGTAKGAASKSLNFAFVAARSTELESLLANAERDWRRDPPACLFRLRTASEFLGRNAAARLGINPSVLKNLSDVIERLEAARVAPDVIAVFNRLRKLGNDAAHRYDGASSDALSALRDALALCAWFERTCFDRAFATPAFRTPSDPEDERRALEASIDALEATRREESRERERLAEEKRLLEESLAEARRIADEAARVASERAVDPKELIAEFLARADEAARGFERREEDVRRDIDSQLRAAGWEADSGELRFPNGARPESGKNRAIAEWPTSSGPVDYALFMGTRAVGVIEAKRENRNVPGAIEQARRYAKSFDQHGEHYSLIEGAPWREHFVPFLLASNGRPYLKQLEDESGVWFLDVRRATNHPRALQGFVSPEGLEARLSEDVTRADSALRDASFDRLELRPYQRNAIAAVERAITEGRKRMLVAMATGTGKTRTATALLHRVLEAKRFRRALFIVDRRSLGEQTSEAFASSRMLGGRTLSEVYNLAGLDKRRPDKETNVHVVTIQSLMKRVMDESSDAPPVDAYDLVIVDECHRGYTLDREATEDELSFADLDEYVSKYRRVIDRFDAVVVGLTATPALHTAEIFGAPVFRYSYTEAVTEGYLAPQEPPYRIETELSRGGITYRVGEKVETYDPVTKATELSEVPDELRFDVEEFNRKVITEGFNRAVCDELAQHIDPELPEKTLVFCVDDRHADLVVRLLKESLDDKLGGVDDECVLKITGRSDKYDQLIRRFRNERRPSVAVTVDLLTTGIDVPAITALVFLRRVKSRILYEQMLGRATRLCPEIGKECFRVYDAVAQCELVGDATDMRPTAVTPKHTFLSLAERALEGGTSARYRDSLREDFARKLRRKRAAIEKDKAVVDEFESLCGEPLRACVARLEEASADEFVRWLVDKPTLVAWLDAPRSSADRRKVIHKGEDRVVNVWQDFGGRSPSDYLRDFDDFVRANRNRVDALMVLATRPKDMTRAQLRSLAVVLEEGGFDERALQAATRAVSNVDVAAKLVGFVRQRAVGDALRSYEERVDRAERELLASRPWSEQQRKWIKRIAAQVRLEVIVDREALESGEFARNGGFAAIDKRFDGRLAEVLSELHERIWQQAG
ncbi:MAG: type I restriction-modification system endonuclease [Polyangiales bacterium]